MRTVQWVEILMTDWDPHLDKEIVEAFRKRPEAAITFCPKCGHTTDIGASQILSTFGLVSKWFCMRRSTHQEPFEVVVLQK